MKSLYSKKMECRIPEENRAASYRLIACRDLFGFMLIRHFGRIGAKGRVMHTRYPKEAELMREFSRLIRVRYAHGYEDVWKVNIQFSIVVLTLFFPCLYSRHWYWSGQVKVDIFLNYFLWSQFYFKFHRSQISKIRMTSLTVVKQFDVINKIPSCLLTTRYKYLPKHSLWFKRSQKAFGNWVSQQSPFRLILNRMAWVFNNSWKSQLQYWLPLSEWNTYPGAGLRLQMAIRIASTTAITGWVITITTTFLFAVLIKKRHISKVSRSSGLSKSSKSSMRYQLQYLFIQPKSHNFNTGIRLSHKISSHSRKIKHKKAGIIIQIINWRFSIWNCM